MSMFKRSPAAFLLFIMVLICQTGFPAEVSIEYLAGRVFLKPADSDPFGITAGKYRLASGTSILTFVDGQLIGETLDKVDVRMKEETIVAFLDTADFEVRKGVAGFKNQQDSIQINTPHVMVKRSEGIIVIKSNSVLTRICIIKGSALLRLASESETLLPEGHEIAAAAGRLSKPYKMSDELRYTWYWVEADKEPALQN